MGVCAAVVRMEAFVEELTSQARASDDACRA
jgi:hypothetical protein